jgi:hypothetical protein
MKRILVLGLLLGAPFAAAQTIHGRILGDEGEAIAEARIEVAGQIVQSDADGRFTVAASARGPFSLRVDADGYYPAVQTFADTMLEAVDGDVGSITIVARRPDRRLLLFAGDAMLARRFFEPPPGDPRLVRPEHVLEDGKRLLAPIKPYIELADFASVNMETQLSSAKLSDRLPKSVTFYSPDEFAELLEWAGFDYVALGNNHTWDYQAQGLASTLAALDDTALGYSGAGFDEVSARAPYLADIGGEPYAFLSYVGWAGTFSPHQAAEGSKGGAALGGSEVFAEDLAATPPAAAAVLQYHSGLEYSDRPAMSERTRLRLAIDDGADIAIGHHAHILQGLEIYKNRLIAYSMGNFLFDQTYYTTQLGMLLYVWMDRDVLYRAEIVPMYVNGYVPTPATGAMHHAILHRIARVSRDLGTCLQANGAHATVVACDEAPVRQVDLGMAQPGEGPVPLYRMGLSALDPVSFAIAGYRYRLGTDILRRGDFESFGLFGIPGRGWILGPGTAIDDGESRHLRLKVPENGTVQTGMSAFQRVFTRSNPTTLAGRIYVDAPVSVRFRLQRRRPGTNLPEALASGPVLTVGGLRLDTPGWQRFSVDFDQPRVGTEAVRLLIDAASDPDLPGGATIRIDDLAWIEWHSPWIDGDNGPGAARHATHVQFRPQP